MLHQRSRMFIPFQPERRDHGQENGLARFGFRPEGADLIAQVVRVGFGDGVGVDAI